MGNSKNRIIGIVSGKGGVGKSTIAVNISALLTKQKKTNVLVDADLSNPSVGLHLGLSYTQIGIQEVLLGKNKISDCIVIQPTTGMRILPSSLKYRREAGLRNLKTLLHAMTAYDYVIVDSAPGITQDAEYLLAACEEVLIITTPDIPGVTSATKTVALCKEAGTKVLGIIVNRITGAKYELSPREISSLTDAPVICQIPEDSTIPASIAARTPAVLYAPSSPASNQLRRLVSMLCGEKIIAVPTPGFLARITDLIKRLFRMK